MKKIGLMALGLCAALATVSQPSYAAVEDGAKLAKKRCKACHTWEEGGKNKIGPNLYGVTTRPAGTTEGYKYGKGFKAAQEAIGDWDDAKLDEYLTDPSKYLSKVAGKKVRSKMTFKLKKKEDRDLMIEFLNSLKKAE